MSDLINLIVIHPTTMNHITGFSFHKIKKMHATRPPSTGPFLPTVTQESVTYLETWVWSPPGQTSELILMAISQTINENYNQDTVQK